MNLGEWPLIVFTILGQMSVGSFLVLVVIHLYAQRKAGMEQADRMSDIAFLAIGPVLILGLIGAIFHLNSPANAWASIGNIGTSWLSREILFGLLFGIVGGVFAIMQWRKIATPTVRWVLAVIAALLGIGLVYSMSALYMLEIQPSWNTAVTPLLFATTTLLLGALAVGAALVANYSYLQRKEPDCAEVQCEILRGAMRGIAVLSMIALGVELVTLPLYLGYLSSVGGAGAQSAAMYFGDYAVVFALRLILVFLGAGILGLFLYRNAVSPGRERFLAGFTYAAFAAVLIAEVMGRFLFYATHMRIGI
jgi:anaerobic dimethyl sulfoxide reductase subunit C (anchor subunit)